MTPVPLACWRCRNKGDYCPMVEEMIEEREFCRESYLQETGEDCGEDLCEECRNDDKPFEFGDEARECTGFEAFAIDTGL